MLHRFFSFKTGLKTYIRKRITNCRVMTFLKLLGYQTAGGLCLSGQTHLNIQ